MEEQPSMESRETWQMHQEQEEMALTMTAQLDGLIVTADNADVSSSTQTHTEEKDDSYGPNSVCQTEDHNDDDDDDDNDSEDSDSSSSSSSSSSLSYASPSALLMEDDDEGVSHLAPIKARDEVLLEELPVVDDVCVSLPEDAELQPVGTVSSIIQRLVIIQSLKDTPPLTDDSVIFTADKKALGKVTEVFGPVSSPLYILHLTSVEQISSKGLIEGLTVYYAPAIKEYTGYILVQQLKLLKGSDASWKNDHEPPEEALDYSDDEKEKAAKMKVKNSKKRRDNNKPDNPVHITQDNLQQQQLPHGGRGFPPRHAALSFRHHNPRTSQPLLRHTHTSTKHMLSQSRQTDVPPVYLPPPCPYPPLPPHHLPPPSFPLFSCPPPSFFNPSFSSPLWPPNPLLFAGLPPPPPPPPPSQ